MTQVTAVTRFHRAGCAAEFGSWAQHLLASARPAPGQVSGRTSVHDEPGLDWAVAVTFSEEAPLHSWLDSRPRVEILSEGQARGSSARSSMTLARPFRKWLDPVDGAGTHICLTGAVAILAIYALTFSVFATVHELQFWDYASWV